MTDKRVRLAVCGNPILHSKSPWLFNSVFIKKSVNAMYSRILADTAAEALAVFHDLDLDGLNVTAPFKAGIMNDLDCIDQAAKLIGGVNTVVKREEKLYGYNTDHLGVVAALKKEIPDLAGKTCAVIGAGAAGRAAVYGLIREGVQVTILNRTTPKAREVAEHFDCEWAGLNHLNHSLKTSDIMISTVTTGIDYAFFDAITDRVVVFDANYKQSFLLKLATERGCRVIKGEEWLVQQAIPAYTHFFGQEVYEDLMVEGLAESSRDNENQLDIIIFGLNERENTEIAQSLSEKLNFSCQGTDSLQNSREGAKGNIYAGENGIFFSQEFEDDAFKRSFLVVFLCSVETDRQLKCKDQTNRFQLLLDQCPLYVDLIVRVDKSLSSIVESIYEEIQAII